MNPLTVLPLLFVQASVDRAAPLFDAIRKGDAAQVRTLLAADPTLAGVRNPDGATPALWAAYTRHPELAAMVLAGRAPDFFEACALGDRQRASALLARDSKLIDAYSADGFTPLGLAVFFGHEELARELVAAGADVNRPSRNAIRVSPLHSAVASGSLALLDLLLEHGARPDPVEFLEATPLHSAAASGSQAMVERLLKAGADPQRKTKEGKTAVDLARQYGHEALAIRLATYSASPRESDGK
jgi:ankyrin repeat protein